MKKFFLITIYLISALLISGSISVQAEPQAPMNGFIDFEDGVDAQPIQSSIPGLQFTTTEGFDWIYGDWRTGLYNGPFPGGEYYSNGNFFAWLGPNQGAGRIDFTQGCATYLQVWVSSAYGLTADAYYSNGTLADSASVAGNLGTGRMERLRVDAPSGNCFSYVILHDTGNFWLIDDLSTDASGVPATRPPVIILPGLMGSKLRNNDSCNNVDEEIWPAIFKIPIPRQPHLDHLRLKENGIDPVSICDFIYPAGIIKNISFYKVYGPLIDYLDNTANFDVHTFDYDWRLDLETTADDLDKFINEILKDPDVDQVNLVGHSLGGLLAREYVTSRASRASKVEQVISLGTPYLGAPKAFKTLRIGDSLINLDDLGQIGLLNEDRVRELVQNGPAFYQILPSKNYFDVIGGYYRLNSSMVGWNQTRAIIHSQHNDALASDAELFHGPPMDDWGSTSVDVAYRVIAGSGIENTIGVFHEFDVIDWFTGKVKTRYDIEGIDGDETVPVHSADLNGNGYYYSGGVPIWYTEDVKHVDLVKKDYILDFLAAILATPPDSNAFARTTTNQSFKPADELSLFQGNSTKFDQPKHVDTVPPTPPEMGDTPFGVDGAQIAAFGEVRVHVYDEFGNHTGPIDDGTRLDLEIPGSSYNTVEGGVFVSVPTGGRYTVEVDSEGSNDFDLRIRDMFGLDQDLIQRTITYSDAPIGSTGIAELEYNPNSNEPIDNLDIDQNGDGQVDLSLPPTGILNPEDSKDVTPPEVTISLDGNISPRGWYIGDVIVTISAVDDQSGLAKVDFSVDRGKHIQPYISPFTIKAEDVSLLIVKATDYAGNEGWETAMVGPSKRFLPIAIRR